VILGVYVTFEVSAYIVFLRSVCRLLVTVEVPSSPILVTLTMDAIRSSEISVPARAKWRNIPEYGILHFLGVVCLLINSSSLKTEAGLLPDHVTLYPSPPSGRLRALRLL
jgi:hypothetical protein